jgi:hypothetical protein
MSEVASERSCDADFCFEEKPFVELWEFLALRISSYMESME